MIIDNGFKFHIITNIYKMLLDHLVVEYWTYVIIWKDY